MPAPKNVKQPEDRKPKAEPEAAPVEDDPPKPRLVTIDGHEWTIPAEALDDFELLDDLGEGTVDRMPSILRRMLGPEQAKAALNTLRDKDTGRVTLEAGVAFVSELLGALNPN